MGETSHAEFNYGHSDFCKHHIVRFHHSCSQRRIQCLLQIYHGIKLCLFCRFGGCLDKKLAICSHRNSTKTWGNKPQMSLLELQSTLKMEMKELLWLLTMSFELVSWACASKETQKSTWYTVGSCLFYDHSERRMQKTINDSPENSYSQLILENKKLVYLYIFGFLLCPSLLLYAQIFHTNKKLQKVYCCQEFNSS